MTGERERTAEKRVDGSGGEGEAGAGDRPGPDAAPETAPSLSPEALGQLLSAGEPVRLLDVRDRTEADAWRIDGPGVTRTQIPYAKFMAAAVRGGVEELADVPGEGPITVVCGEGEASGYVAGLLSAAGIEAQNLAGGMAAWARVYEARELDAEPGVIQYDRPAGGCLSYMVVSAGEAAVVDPLRAFADRYATDAADRDAEIVAVLDTHVHADHVSGLRAVSAATGARRFVPAGARDRRLAFEAEAVEAGDRVAVGDTAVEAVSLPGHTTEMTGYRVGGVLLSGDSLFLDGVARPDLQAGADETALAGELYATLTERLSGVDGVLAPGHHEPETTRTTDGTYTGPVGAARERALRGGEDEAAFVERVTAGRPEPRNAARIVAVNLGRESVDDDAAFELELGPNNCAA